MIRFIKMFVASYVWLVIIIVYTSIASVLLLPMLAFDEDYATDKIEAILDIRDKFEGWAKR